MKLRKEQSVYIELSLTQLLLSFLDAEMRKGTKEV